MSESSKDLDDEVRRGRPGRRSGKEHTEAVLALLAGKKSVDALARQFGVNSATIQSWRATALEGIEASMRSGDGPSARERMLEREVDSLKEALTDTSIAPDPGSVDMIAA